MDLKILRKYNSIRQKEWNGNKSVPLSFRGNELAGEVGEACNIIKKIDREAMGFVGSRATAAELADELADIIICVDLIAIEMDIDLSTKIPEKFNHTSRKYKLDTRIPNEDI